MQKYNRQKQKYLCFQVQLALFNKHGRNAEEKAAPGQRALGHGGPGEVPRRLAQQEGAPRQGLVHGAVVEIPAVDRDQLCLKHFDLSLRMSHNGSQSPK